ncbi:Oidioi.mRNA.OKI2018_I69.PAR.g11234.t2.cds [Oikopleura dioica]|uniref:Oidioi.mRNA.OKI2018_I69.PAR.g11234.t2.cds n=1 Tax=Oikopleura dioica TaxID=34765 RepID=A0ABN7S248_OIKDI|nr:Oidioi.mRNA.OKI2018_I69.PAR.g11234.t2.cds [Oikopleura dioica]
MRLRFLDESLLKSGDNENQDPKKEGEDSVPEIKTERRKSIYRDGQGRLSLRRLSLIMQDEINQRKRITVRLTEYHKEFAMDTKFAEYRQRRQSQIPFDIRVGIKKTQERVEPTFKMEPDEKPDIKAIKFMMSRILKKKCTSMSRTNPTPLRANEELHNQIKNILPTRYRLIVQVISVRDEGQTFRSASNFLWNPKYDYYVSVEVKHGNLILHGSCFLIYLE